MPARILLHGMAGTTTCVAGLTAGDWNDLTRQAQFLIDLEFLTRYTNPTDTPNETACVYTRSPPYLQEIACQFPWVHFYAFSHPAPPVDTGEDYDPAQPDMVKDTGFTLHTEHNKTVSPFEFSKDSAVTLSRSRGGSSAESRVVMICHGETSMRQVHAQLSRASPHNASLVLA
jgi:hypothetical protein